MGISQEHYNALVAASKAFWTQKDYSFPQTEAVMTSVFGIDRSSTEARAWSTFWVDLTNADEKRDAGEDYVKVRGRCHHFC